MTDENLVLLDHLQALYGEPRGREILGRLLDLIDHHRPQGQPAAGWTELTQRDSVLITYADQVQDPGQPPLRALAAFAEEHLRDLVSSIHLLPFYPWSSDDGFAVKDYRAVDPTIGDWSDIALLGRRFRLMFDAVINHASAQGDWFLAFRRGARPHRDFFLVIEGEPDLSRVVRPRTLPLLTRFDTSTGPRVVWTTFSADQVDLDYHNPEVLLEILDTILFYVDQGASLLRLDAIAYLWKEPGTACIHLPQTHRVIQLIRAVVKRAAPGVLLITETNVPHQENISYFGDGTNEAHLVYNFALPPLVLQALRSGHAGTLASWARTLQPSLPPGPVTFFNFLASHDGIGLGPVGHLLPPTAIEELVRATVAGGGQVSLRDNPGGPPSPYELNINYFDALAAPRAGEPPALQEERFLTAQAIMLALAGVPGIYFHSLLGSRGWPEGAQETGRARTVNRQRCYLSDLRRELADPASRRHRIFHRYARLLRARAASAAFHPRGPQEVLSWHPHLLTLLRLAPDRSERVLCLHNVGPTAIAIETRWLASLDGASGPAASLTPLGEGELPLANPPVLGPYQSLWLRL